MSISQSVTCLFEHPQFFILHKPANMPFHSLEEISPNGDAILVEGVVSLAKRLLGIETIYPVHRLDRMTSGLMIFARSKEATAELSSLFEHKKIEKYYLALSASKPKKKQGVISGDMLKSRGGSYILQRTHNNPAVTRFFCQRLALNEGTAWFFVLKPETGKTHQLRVALKSLGSPIWGDQRYSGSPEKRGYLHAYKLRFDAFGERFTFTDPHFSGELFSLLECAPCLCHQTENSLDGRNQDYANTSLTDCAPENLPWPKATFLLEN